MKNDLFKRFYTWAHLIAGCGIGWVALVALAEDRRLPHRGAMAWAVVWGVACSAAGYVLYSEALERRVTVSTIIWRSTRVILSVFVLLGGFASLSSWDHAAKLPNANAYLMLFLASLAAGWYFANADKVHAAMQEAG